MHLTNHVHVNRHGMCFCLILFFFKALTLLYISVIGVFCGDLHQWKKINSCKLYLFAKTWSYRFKRHEGIGKKETFYF